MKKNNIFRKMIIVFLTIGIISIPSFAQTFECKISNPGSKLRTLSTEGAWVDFTLTNQSDAPLFILKYQTPVDGIEKNLFDVELNGEKLPYKDSWL